MLEEARHLFVFLAAKILHCRICLLQWRPGCSCFRIPPSIDCRLAQFMNHFGQELLYSFAHTFWAWCFRADVCFKSKLSSEVVPRRWTNGRNDVSHLRQWLPIELASLISSTLPFVCEHIPIVDVSQTS